MTLRDLEHTLSCAGVESARADILTLAAHVSGLGTASLAARLDDGIDAERWFPALCMLADRRAAREPLQYILGKWEFYGDEYNVTRDTLIPRSETELLAETAISILPPHAVIADLCCGSGCIGIAVCRRTDARCYSVDISAPALAVAEENARALGVCDRVTFLRGDVLTGDALPDAAFDMIISNPPYIKTDVIDTLAPELSFEPRIALDGGGDGMAFYRAIVSNCKSSLRRGGSFLFEIGSDEADEIKNIARAHGFSAEIAADLSGLPRTALLKPNTK